MRLVRIDRLHVNGSLDAKKYRPADIEGRPVQVVVSLPDNQERDIHRQDRVRKATRRRR